MTEQERMNILRMSNEEANLITRECMKKALVRLLGKKELNRISITEIVTVAGVSRTAFYRNYATIEALLEDVTFTIRDLVMERIRKWREAGTQEERIQEITDCFRAIRENSAELCQLLTSGRQLLHPEDLKTCFACEDIRTLYASVALASALLGIMTRWLLSGMQETPEEMGVLCCQLLSETNAGALPEGTA